MHENVLITFLFLCFVLKVTLFLREIVSNKGTGHNKFVRRGPTLSGVGGGGGLSRTPPTCFS